MFIRIKTLASAQKPTDMTVKSFEDEKIPPNNISGFCSDTTNVMFGAFNSVAKKLKEKIPRLNVIQCNAHMMHPSAKSAIKKFPSTSRTF